MYLGSTSPLTCALTVCSRSVRGSQQSEPGSQMGPVVLWSWGADRALNVCLLSRNFHCLHFSFFQLDTEGSERPGPTQGHTADSWGARGSPGLPPPPRGFLQVWALRTPDPVPAPHPAGCPPGLELTPATYTPQPPAQLSGDCVTSSALGHNQRGPGWVLSFPQSSRGLPAAAPLAPKAAPSPPPPRQAEGGEGGGPGREAEAQMARPFPRRFWSAGCPRSHKSPSLGGRSPSL